MATINDKSIIKTILENNGIYPGDPQCYTIWSYKNDFGKETQAIFMGPGNDILSSPYCHNPKLLWARKSGLTEDGQRWLETYDKVTIYKLCMVCGKESEVHVDQEGFIAWQNGTKVQDAFPNMTPCDREILITGTHPNCWKVLFDDDESFQEAN